jgi:hypothetical protein
MGTYIAVLLIGVVMGVVLECFLHGASSPHLCGFIKVNLEDPTKEPIEIHFTENFLSDDKVLLDVIHDSTPDISQG